VVFGNQKLKPAWRTTPVFVVFLLPLSNDTGTLDTLYQVLLAEEVDNNKRKNNKYSAGIGNCFCVKVGTAGKSGKGDRNLNDIGHKLEACGSNGGEEHTVIELIGPLPCEGEQENCYHHGNGQRKNYLKEGTEHAATVDVCRLLKLIGNSLEEVSHHEDVQTVLKRKSGDGQYEQRPEGVGEVGKLLYKSGRLQYFEETGNAGEDGKIEISELHVHGQVKSTVRNDHGEDNQHKYEVTTLELELGKSVSDNTADEGLAYRTHKGKKCGIQKCGEVIVLHDDLPVVVKGGVSRDHLNGYVNEVLRAHE